MFGAISVVRNIAPPPTRVVQPPPSIIHYISLFRTIRSYDTSIIKIHQNGNRTKLLRRHVPRCFDAIFSFAYRRPCRRATFSRGGVRGRADSRDFPLRGWPRTASVEISRIRVPVSTLCGELKVVRYTPGRGWFFFF